jgi:hypothetical protein
MTASSATLSTLESRVQVLLSDANARVYSEDLLEEAIRLALGEYSTRAQQVYTLEDLDEAEATTIPDYFDSVVVIGAAGHAAKARALDRADSFTQGETLPADLDAWGETQLTRFRSILDGLFPETVTSEAMALLEAKIAADVAAAEAKAAVEADAAEAKAAADQALLEARLEAEVAAAEAKVAADQAAAQAKYDADTSLAVDKAGANMDLLNAKTAASAAAAQAKLDAAAALQAIEDARRSELQNATDPPYDLTTGWKLDDE